MPTVSEGLGWLKQQFGEDLQQAISGTPYTAALLSAIAVQETFEVWGGLFQTSMSTDDILALCVGDTFDAPNRSAFPPTKQDLIAVPDGQQMFDIARAALEAIGVHNTTYRKVAQGNPNKFCHAFGIFQYDLQHFQRDPDFFLQRQWVRFAPCLQRVIQQLDAAKARTYGTHKTALTDRESVYVAIAYNAGHADLNQDFRQGFQDSSGKFYGEQVASFLDTANDILTV